MEISPSATAGEQDAESPPNLGTRLRSARKAQHLSLEDLAAELRISPDFLTALEECRFDVLGAPVFAKGYLKQYGARLGLNPSELAADYELAAGHTSVEITPLRTIRLRDERQITIWVAASITLALIAGLLLTWWLQQPVTDFVVATPERIPPATATVAREPDVERAVPDPAEPASAEETAPAQPAAGLVAAPQTEPVAEPEIVLPAVSAANSVTDTEAAAETRADRLAAVAPADTVAIIDGPALEVFFVEDSWAEITDEDGSRLYYDLGRAGTRRLFPASRNLNLLFGNARGVELSVDGRALPIPGSPRRGDVAQFDLNALLD